MTMRRMATVTFLALAVLPLRVMPDDIQYASDVELTTELAERRQDILRTESRIASLNAEEATWKQSLIEARDADRDAELVASKRARMFYRISKQGGGLRFVLNSESVMDFMKRATLMRQLVTDGLDARREAGLRVAAAEQTLSTIREEKAAAQSMHAMLVQTFDELTREINRRRGRPN